MCKSIKWSAEHLRSTRRKRPFSIVYAISHDDSRLESIISKYNVKDNSCIKSQ